MLRERLDLEVEVRGEPWIQAHGTVRGRSVVVEIEGSGGRREFARFLFGRSVMDDVRIHVGRAELRIDDESTAVLGKGANYLADSLIYHYLSSPQPWPERALVGPVWWIDLMCDLADALEH